MFSIITASPLPPPLPLLCEQCHVFSRGYLHAPDLSLDTVLHFLSHLRPALAVTLLRHKGLADWIHAVDQEAPAAGGEGSSDGDEKWRESAIVPGEMANRLEKW
mgnify:CR=1 FL=1